MMEEAMPGRKDYFEAFIKTAQYLTGLTTQQDIWSETGKVLVHFFGADVGGFEERRPDGKAAGCHWTFSERFSIRGDLEAETGEAIAEVLESGFISERIIHTPDPISVACFPVAQENKVIAVMVAGHGMSERLPRELLNIYMAVAGLVGTTFTRLASEQELRRHREHLEQLVKERTAELTKVNKQLQQKIAEHMQAANALRESEERFRSVVDNVGIGIALISPNMEILELNTQMRKWFPRADVSTRPICYRTFNDPPREAICSYCPTYLTLQDGEVHESITETPARDEIRNYRIISSPIKDKAGNVTAAIKMVEDITEDLEIREKLSRSERLYRTLFETTGAATILVDDDMTILMTNEEFENLTGYTKQEVDGKKKWTELVEKCDLARLKEYHKLRRIDPNVPPRTYEFSLTDRYGNKKEILSTVSIIPGTKRSIASFLDITDLKRLDEEIRESEAKYRLLAENISDIIWTTDTNLKLTYISPSVEKLRGYNVDEAMKQPLREILTPASYKTAMNAFREAIAREKVKRGDLEEPTTLELEMIRKDGSTIWTEVNMTFLRDSDGRIEEILGVTRDITQRKQAEGELELKSRHLEETNTALKVLLEHIEADKEELQENVLSNVRELIIPYIEKAKTCRYKSDQENYLSILEANLNNIISPFLHNLRLDQCNLTPKEIQIANLIKEGKTTKEIADLLYLSLRTINFHRENIRKKLGLTNKKANLQSHLLSLS